MRARCDGRVGSVLIGVSFAISLLVLVVLVVLVGVVGDTARENSIPLLPDPPLIQYEPGHEPGGLQEEDAGQTYGGVDTEGLEPRHVLKKQTVSTVTTASCDSP